MYQKVSKYYDYDGRNKIGKFKISQKVMHRYIYAKPACKNARKSRIQS